MEEIRQVFTELVQGAGLTSSEGPTTVPLPAVSPAPSSTNSTAGSTEEKKYYCQRCLNHGFHFNRKGHKPYCKYSNCNCSKCSMVEERRQLNNMLNKGRAGHGNEKKTINGRKIRDPQCARCNAHGIQIPLRGHKKTSCPFYTCDCQLCGLVENRRSLMAAQIKLRRHQQKERGQEGGGSQRASTSTAPSTLETDGNNNKENDEPETSASTSTTGASSSSEHIDVESITAPSPSPLLAPRPIMPVSMPSPQSILPASSLAQMPLHQLATSMPGMHPLLQNLNITNTFNMGALPTMPMMQPMVPFPFMSQPSSSLLNLPSVPLQLPMDAGNQMALFLFQQQFYLNLQKMLSQGK